MFRSTVQARAQRERPFHRSPMNYRIAILSVLALASAGCNRPGEDSNAFRWTTSLPAGAVVHLRNGAGDIVVRRAAGQAVLVNGSRRWNRGRAKDVHFAMKQIGNDYYVCAMWRASGSCGDGTYRGRQTGGFLQMFSLFHRTTDASAGIVAEVPANVVLDARTANGSVEIDGLSAGVTARTSNGTVRASNVAGPVVLATTNGDVRMSIDSLSPGGSIDLTARNGSIHAELPANAEGNFDLSTVNGAVRSDFPVPAAADSRSGRHLMGQIGASNRVVKMRAMNGTVSVVSRGAPTAH
jgi:hypothetical protein